MYDPAIPLLGISSKELKAETWTDIGTFKFIIALFTRAKSWNQPKCPLTDEQMNKMWYIHAMEYYLVIKRNVIGNMLQHGWT